MIDVPRGIVIPDDEAEVCFIQNFTDYKQYQNTIGGYFQVIDLTDPECSLFMDEDGKLKSLPMNRRATLLMWMHNPQFRGFDVVCGTAVLIGQPDHNGDTQDIPQELCNLLLDTKSYRYEVQVLNDPLSWVGNQAVYDNWVDAYNAALGLAQRWLLVDKVRVVPA